ncbi:MAG: DUF4837 family protein [Bacteroidales bacterium]|nr:DUF4837 family protein [Bacteroidales bacterium]
MKRLQTFALIIALATAFSACSDKKTEHRKDRSVGGTSEILFVTQNDEQWDGQMGQAVRDFFEQDQYGLPQPEKNFRVAHINITALNDMFKRHRNLIIGEIVPDLTNPTIEMQDDWQASPQYAIKIKAKDAASWVKVFDSQKDELKTIFDKNERERFMEFFRPMTNVKVMETLKTTYGFTMTVPEGYYVAKNENHFTWIRKEEPDKSFGLIIYQLPYKSTEDLSEARIIKKTDSITKKYIPGPADGSYMTLDKEFVKPVFNIIPYFPAGYAVEMRGLWKTEGEFMAGPYASYTIVNPEANKLITVEGYIYYPNKAKRDLLRQLETIIWSLKF